MTFAIMGRGFENGPTERYEFKFPLDSTQGPSWSRNILVELAPTIFQSVPRCRAIHPDHDCQCISKLDHRGGSDSRHHCWHNQAGTDSTAYEWQAWRRGKRDLERVPDGRTLVSGGVYGQSATGKIHIEQARVTQTSPGTTTVAR